jgi:hypothetical protein
MRNTISRVITTALLAVGLLVCEFTASAATIYMTPAVQNVPDNASFMVDIWASGLPAGTVGGGMDVSWNAADMTLDSVYLATTDPADSNGGSFLGAWDPTNSFFSGPGTIGPGSLSNLFVGSFEGLAGDQPIARLNFTLSSGVSNSVISLVEGSPLNEWGNLNDPYTVTNDYIGATINPVPVPAAFWLFGSGLVGLVGMVRRRG